MTTRHEMLVLQCGRRCRYEAVEFSNINVRCGKTHLKELRTTGPGNDLLIPRAGLGNPLDFNVLEPKYSRIIYNMSVMFCKSFIFI